MILICVADEGPETELNIQDDKLRNNLTPELML